MIELLTNPIFYRGMERLMIVAASLAFAYLGFRLFQLGIDKGHSKLNTESKMFKLTFSGSGPGLFFMAFGAIVFMTALFTGGAELEKAADGSVRSNIKGSGAAAERPADDFNPLESLMDESESDGESEN